MAETPENDATLHDAGPPASMMADGDIPPPAPKPERGNRKGLLLAIKIAVSVGGLLLVWNKLSARDGFEGIADKLSELHWGWFAGAMAMQLVAIGAAIMRWRTVLGGQGIRPTFGFMFPSFMIGRFWGAFTPGGLGLDGWKVLDVGVHTKKYARVVAVAGVEKILGWLAFGLVVMGASVWGVAFVGVKGVVIINAFFLALVTAGMTLLLRPNLFRALFGLLPRRVQPWLKTLLHAVCAYQGKPRLLTKGFVYGVLVHAFNNLIYVCAARALGVDLGVGLIFFGSSLTILVTLVPISINGVGLREAAAVALYTTAAVGLSESTAVLIPIVGFTAEMLVSATGIGFLMARKFGTSVAANIAVEDPEREDQIYDAVSAEAVDGSTEGAAKPFRPSLARLVEAFRTYVPVVPEAARPSKLRGLTLGLGAGLVAGMIVGVAEATVILIDGGGRAGYGVLAYGAVAYGLLCTLGGGALGLASAMLGRRMSRKAVPEPTAYAGFTALIVSVMAFALGAFRIRRDVFHEELVWKSLGGLGVLLGCALAAAVLFVMIAFTLRTLTSAKLGRPMLRAWGSPAVFSAVVGALVVVSFTVSPAAEAEVTGRAEAPEGAPNLLVIVVDTLRADHLPGYGYEGGATPSLDRFAEDSVRYEQAFANASWTRPSFASILTGRYASSHGVMGKPDSLSDEVTTLAESLHGGGYTTAGYVTNFNVGPYFNFQQGFQTYTFLEPEFVLGADDSAAKLLLVQALRQNIEKLRQRGGQVEPGSAYQDAETVNRHLVGWLDQQQAAERTAPWFLFAGYMDPHDPYFPHPYDGSGYSRAANQHPNPDEAPALRALYDGEITYWDAQFGALMDELRRRGLYDDMMIVVTSDHGEEFAEHGGFWHGTTLYDEQVHVPLYVKLPRNERAGTRVTHWVQSVDLMPTILARVGLELPDGVQGGSLEEGTTRVYAEESHEGNVLESVRELRDFEARKLITANPGNPRGLETVELYRVDDDRGEQHNVAEAERADVQALMRALDEAREHAAEGAVEGVEVEMDEESRRQLCQIGYIDAQVCCSQGLLTGSQCRGS